MSKIDRIGRSACRVITDKAEAALKVLADELGMTLSRETSRYGTDTVTVKMTFKVTGANGVATADANNAVLLGLPADVIGQTFRAGGTLYTVSGIVMRRRKYPVSATGPQGGRYKFETSRVLAGLTKVAA